MSRESDDNQHLPPWLRGVPLPTRPAATSAPSAAAASALWAEPPAASTAAQPEEIPDWLKELSAETGLESPAAASDAPAWPDDQPSVASDAASAGTVLGWVQDTSQEQAQPEEGPGADAALPDWLRDAAGEPPAETSTFSQPAPSPQAHESLPAWLSDAAAESPDQPSTPAEPLPSWLSGLVADERSAATFDQPLSDQTTTDAGDRGEALPDWLRDQGGASATAPGNEGSTASLWADTGSSPGAPVAPSGSVSETGEVDESGVPSWLRDIPDDEIRKVMEGDEDQEDEISVEPFAFGEPSGAPSGASTPDVPAWLPDASEDGGDPEEGPSWLGGLTDEPVQAGVSGDLEEGPSWLGGLTDEPVQPESGSSTDIPLWLQDLEAASPSETRAEASDQPIAEEPAAVPPTSESAESIPAWLRPTEQAPAESGAVPAWLQAEASDAAPAEELPAWLNAEVPAAPPAEVPSWLSADIAAPPASSGAAPLPAEDLPPWLSDAITSTPPPGALPPVESQSPPPAPSAPPLGPADELPAWLRTEEAAPPAEELPDWLQTSPLPASAATAPDASSPPAAVPDWLQSSSPPAPAPTPVDGSTDELPPWLRDDAGQPLPTAGAPGDANLPEWLRGESPGGSGVSAASTPPAVPDWLGVEPSAPEAPASPPSLDWFEEDKEASPAARASASESEFFGGTELPAWLRKAEAEPTSEISPTDARSLDWLTRLGAHEDEAAVVAATPAIKLPLPQAPARSESQRSALALLQRLAAQPYPDAAPAPVPAQVGVWQRIGLDRVLYFVLLGVLLAALAIPSLAAGLQSPPQDPAAAALFEQIDALTDKDVVLIGYEWDARRIGELKPLEKAVIGHLIQKRVKLILVSTDPQGSLLLFDLRDVLVRAGYRSDAQDYILLGYKPGGELALRSLAQDFRGALKSDFQGNDATVSALVGGFETGKPINSLNDLAMTLVLADDASDVQGWVEQIYRSAKQKPLAFLLPAEAAPIVQPYLQPPRDPQDAQIGHLAGKQGALAYEHLQGDQTASVQIARETGQQRLGILVFVVLLLIGGIVAMASGALRQGAGA